MSDIHMGHSRTPTKKIAANIKKAFPNTPETGKIDLLLIPGDFFDKIQTAPSEAMDIAFDLVLYLIRLAKRWNIVIRVLEGTPSHDRNQSKIFSHINESLDNPVDCKYIDCLFIEKIEAFDITMLYIPDEWDSDPNITWGSVKELLTLHGLEKVDFAMMHGMFEHQLPKGIQLSHHKASNYLSVVEHYIFIGHVHQSSVMDRIISQGSFDRLCFGEEEKKGHFRLLVHPTDPTQNEIHFIVNEDAKVYKTFDLSNLDIDDARATLEEVSKLPEDAWIRVRLRRNPELLALYDSFKERHYGFVWKHEFVKVVDESPIEEKLSFKTEAVPLNKNTVMTLVEERLIANGNENKDRVLKKLEELTNGAD